MDVSPYRAVGISLMVWVIIAVVVSMVGMGSVVYEVVTL